MILLKDTKGKTRKVNKLDQKKVLNYQGLPGIHTFVKEVIKSTQEVKAVLWKQQKEL